MCLSCYFAMFEQLLDVLSDFLIGVTWCFLVASGAFDLSPM